MDFLQWLGDNWGVLCICLGIFVNGAGLIWNVCKFLRLGGLHRAEDWLAVREAARRFECEAEALTDLGGAQKLQYVLYRLREFVGQLGSHFEEGDLIAAVEADIAFSKAVNADKSEELE